MSLSEAATPSPRGLGRLRSRNKGSANSSTSLLASSGESDNAAGRIIGEKNSDGGLRASMESAIGKVKQRTRRRSINTRGGNNNNNNRTQDDDDPTGNKITALVTKAKQKIKRSDRAEDVDRSTSVDLGNEPVSANRSDSSLFLGGSGRSSLFTEDERIESDGVSARAEAHVAARHAAILSQVFKEPANRKPIRPSLSPRESHAGYLTLSSPEISATATIVPPSTEFVASHIESLPPNIPRIIEPVNGVDNHPSPTVSERSDSPTKRARGAFTLSRKKSRGEDTTKTTAGGSGGLSGLFKSSSRRNSLSVGQQVEGGVTLGNSKGQQAPQDPDQERPETPKRRGRQPIDLTLPATPPNFYAQPTTLVTPPTPTDTYANAVTFSRPTSSQGITSISRPPSSIESIRHRRAQSANLPSKLSTSLNPPLPPTVEETKTPGGTLTQPLPTAGFFSGFFSAAQKAGAQFSNSINTSILPTQKNKPNQTNHEEATGGEEVIPGVGSRPTSETGEPSQPLAVETLGTGSLNFSHLGISETADTSPMNSTTDLQQSAAAQTAHSNDTKEEEAARRAVSSAYEKPINSPQSQINGRPSSIASNERLTLHGDQTPPRAVIDHEAIFKRSGSVRSKLSGRRKHRGSSATAGTSNSIAAGLKNSSAGLANPAMNGPGHRLTGFAVASSKRNKDFHQLFRSVPEDDYLIEDYSAALQRDILLHGRLYVSEGHVCFSSNILGWVTNLVISFDEVVSVEKKSTAVIFPNAIVISTLHARNTFASFVARDSTYELLIGIWKISHPNLKSSLNGVLLVDAGTGDKTEVAEPEGSDDETEEGTEDEIYDEDAEDDAGSFTDGGLVASTAGSEIGDTSISKKTFAIPVSTSAQANAPVSKGLESSDAVVTGAALSSEFPGPPTHEPTQCSESSEHYDRPLTDTTIPAPLGKVYSMMFGPASGAFMRKWLVEDQNSGNLNYVDDKTGLDNDHTTFTFDYIKPLSNPMGPRQTKCITTNTLKSLDLEKAVSIDCSTSTPDVPSGNVFTTKTRYCLMWGPGNSTRIVASCTIEWTGKSWLKGPIEKGAEGGQIDYLKDIVAALKAAVTTKPPVKGLARKGKRKGKKEVYDAEEANNQRDATIASEQKTQAQGIFEPLRQILEPIGGVLRPFITSQVIIAVLFVLLAYTWFAPLRGNAGVSFPGFTSPERIAAYEEIWRREESALWDWLEDRVGLDDLHAMPLNGRQQDRQKVLRAKAMGKTLHDERMTERQMDEKIRTTEQKLAALKEAVERQKGHNKPSGRSS